MKLPDKLPTLSKNLFFGIGFIFFTSMVLLLNWILLLPVNKADQIVQRLSVTEQKIQRLQALQSDILLTLEQEKELFDGSTDDPVKNAFGNIRQDIEFYRSFSLVTHNREVLDGFDQLAATAGQYQNNLNELILAVNERGSATSGLIARWKESCATMEAASAKEKTETVRDLATIRQLEHEYLLTPELQTLDAISALAAGISGNLSGKEGGILSSDAERYVTLTANLKSLDLRLGLTTANGLMQAVPADLNRVMESSDQINGLLQEIIRKIRFRWSFIRILVIMLFTVAGIFGVILMTHLTITRPLIRASGDLGMIAAGELPDVAVSKGGLPEVVRIGKSMVELVDRLQVKTAFARSLNEDKLDNDLPPAGKNDALGAELNQLRRKIKDNADQQKRNEEENIRRSYINDGLARFAEILRTSNNDITSLGDVFIRELVKYLGSIQGGFFLLEENNMGKPVLNLVSSFAYNRKKYLQKSLALGEGLVGTCAREKQMINMTEIPAGYISITSGLGDTRPDNLLLLPVLHENDLVGVLEVASLNKYQGHQLEFASEVASSLGSTLVYTRNNQRTAELLRKSQQQAQEMAEQEEEMRQNMEELKATQEESLRREEELAGMAEAINRSLFVTTYATDGRITDANDRLCIFLGRNLEDMEGLPHQEVFRGSLKPDALFWEELERNGRAVATDKVRIGKKDYRLKFHFSTVCNSDGILLRFISFITDLTA